MLMSAYNTTQCQNPDDFNLNLSYVCEWNINICVQFAHSYTVHHTLWLNFTRINQFTKIVISQSNDWILTGGCSLFVPNFDCKANVNAINIRRNELL